MFEVGFSELLMVGLVALLVIGPEKLPKVARIAGFWLGKSRQTIALLQAEIKQELYADEMRQLMSQQNIKDELKQTLTDTEATISDINAAMSAISSDIDTKLKDDKIA